MIPAGTTFADVAIGGATFSAADLGAPKTGARRQRRVAHRRHARACKARSSRRMATYTFAIDARVDSAANDGSTITNVATADAARRRDREFAAGDDDRAVASAAVAAAKARQSHNGADRRFGHVHADGDADRARSRARSRSSIRSIPRSSSAPSRSTAPPSPAAPRRCRRRRHALLRRRRTHRHRRAAGGRHAVRAARGRDRRHRAAVGGARRCRTSPRSPTPAGAAQQTARAAHRLQRRRRPARRSPSPPPSSPPPRTTSCPSSCRPACRSAPPRSARRSCTLTPSQGLRVGRRARHRRRRQRPCRSSRSRRARRCSSPSAPSPPGATVAARARAPQRPRRRRRTRDAARRSSPRTPTRSPARSPAVRVEADAEFDLGTLLGEVYRDDNGNGQRDRGEPGIGGATRRHGRRPASGHRRARAAITWPRSCPAIAPSRSPSTRCRPARAHHRRDAHRAGHAGLARSRSTSACACRRPSRRWRARRSRRCCPSCASTDAGGLIYRLAGSAVVGARVTVDGHAARVDKTGAWSRRRHAAPRAATASRRSPSGPTAASSSPRATSSGPSAPKAARSSSRATTMPRLTLRFPAGALAEPTFLLEGAATAPCARSPSPARRSSPDKTGKVAVKLRVPESGAGIAVDVALRRRPEDARFDHTLAGRGRLRAARRPRRRQGRLRAEVRRRRRLSRASTRKGRVKLYAKGRIQGRWLLEGGIDIDTSQLESWRDLFRGDPHAHLPQPRSRSLLHRLRRRLADDASGAVERAPLRAHRHRSLGAAVRQLPDRPHRRRDGPLLARGHRRARRLRARRRRSQRASRRRR